MKKFIGSVLVLCLAVAAKVAGEDISFNFFSTNQIPMPNNMEFQELQSMVAPGLQQSLQVAIDAFTSNMPGNQMNKLVGVSTLLQDLCAKVVDIQSMDTYVIQLGCGTGRPSGDGPQGIGSGNGVGPGGFGGGRRQLEVKLPPEAVEAFKSRGLQTNADEVIAFLLTLLDVVLDAFCCFCFLFETTSPSECICECATNPFPLPTQVPANVPFDFPSFEPILPSFLPGPTDDPSAAPSTPQPSLSPVTPAPSASPTDQPTPDPTPAPVTPAPTDFPTPNPTPEPTPMPTNAPCPICGVVGGVITNNSTIIGIMNATCASVNEMGLMNEIPGPEFCGTLQSPGVAVDLCGCTGFLTPEPTVAPTPNPTPLPTSAPVTSAPTSEPTFGPTPEPTGAPVTSAPTGEPTFGPTPEPTTEPTPGPTPEPSVQPTPNPTPQPTARGTAGPTPDPTGMPTNPACPVCGLLGGMITAPDAVVNMDPFVTMTCEQVNQLGLENGIPPMECNTIQTAVARDTCLCSGSFTPEPTVVPTPNPTPEPTPAPTMVSTLPSAGGPTKSPSGKGKSGKGKSSSGKGKSGKGKSSSSYSDAYDGSDPVVTVRDSFPTDAPVEIVTSTSQSATNNTDEGVPVWTIPAVFAGTIVLVLAIMAVRRRRARPARSSSSSRNRSSSRSRSGSSRSSSNSPTGRVS